MVAQTVVGIDLFTKVILPFILIFTLVFAILEKSKIFGEGKKQINSIIALVIGFLIIGVPLALNIINTIIPVISVIAVVILVFMLILGFTGATTKEGNLAKPLQAIFGIIATIAIVVVILVVTGTYKKILEWSQNPTASNVWSAIIFIGIAAAVFAILFKSGGEQKAKEG